MVAATRRSADVATRFVGVYGYTPRCSAHTDVIPPQVVVLHPQVVHREIPGYAQEIPQTTDTTVLV